MREYLNPAQQFNKSDPLSPGNRLILQRKCACDQHTVANDECEPCRKERLRVQRWDKDHTGPVLPMADFAAAASTVPSRFGADFTRVQLHTSRPIIQRMPRGESASISAEPTADQAAVVEPAAVSPPKPVEATPISEPTTPETTPAEPETEPTTSEETAVPGLLVADDTTDLGEGQMRKSEFLSELRTAICAAADTELAAAGRDTEGCPYLDYWFDYYGQRDAGYIERALSRYAPQVRTATSARDYIPIVAERVRQGVARWARTGEIRGVPESVPTTVPGEPPAESGPSVQAKARPGGARLDDDPEAIQEQLGNGRSLDSGVRSRMESAFGTSFGHVRLHNDNNAAHLSSSQNARAFTVGEHVAFGAGEYQPGTLLGDALIAHELAHVVQQGGTTDTIANMEVGNAGYDALERDADRTAVGALASLWGDGASGLDKVRENAIPRLRSGLRLQRCRNDSKQQPQQEQPQEQQEQQPQPETPPTVSIAEVNAPNTPSTVKRIPPRVDTEVAVTVQGSTTSSVTLSIDGAGTDNGSATINGAATHNLTSNETVKLRGVGQTEPGHAENLKVVAHQGTNKLAESNGFSVAAYPKAIGFDFNQVLIAFVHPSIPNSKFWGAKYDLTFDSDSGTDGDCDRTKISENVLVDTAEGLWAGASPNTSNFIRTTNPQSDHHATGAKNAAQMKQRMNGANLTKSKYIAHQFFRFSCERTGIAEDKTGGPKVPTSGFKVTRTASKTAGNYFIHVQKEGFANNGVAAGTVDDTSVKDAEVRD